MKKSFANPPFWNSPHAIKVLAVVLYAAVVVAVMPPASPVVNAMSHDSAYLALVAHNLLEGRGYVNDAHWLVFIDPERLPLPYHNANPLYPTAMAALAWMTGAGVIWSGLFISALSNAMLFAALLVLASRFTPSITKQALVALAGATFPATFSTALYLIADALWLALIAWFFVFLTAPRHVVSLLGAGVLLGLAWLTRSATVFVLPAVVIFLFLIEGWKKTVWHAAIVAVAAVLVASPWLIHQTQVWGNPLRGDGAYYLLQDYHAHKQFDGDVERYWHSPERPASLSELLRREPVALMTFVVKGIPRVIYNLLAHASNGSKFIAVLLAVLSLFAVGRLFGGWCTQSYNRNVTAVLAACIAYALTILLVLSIRPYSVEIRYFALCTTLFGVLLMFGVLEAWQLLQRSGPMERTGYGSRLVKLIAATILALSAIQWLFVTPYQLYLDRRHAASVDLQRQIYLGAARHLISLQHVHGPVVVGTHPYLFTLATGSNSLSIPQSNDDFLGRYMKKYGAQHILLTQEELNYWRPAWTTPKGRPAQLERIAERNNVILFRWKVDS